MSKSYEIKYLLTLVSDDPSNWVVRKEAALKLYEAGEFLDAANMVWQAPEIPSTDMDVAFAVKIVSRARPNRSIRLVYELWRQNAGKAEQNIAMANVFNLIGFPMLASRCYGAAMALNEKYFDMGFESEAFLTDDSEVLSTQWSQYRDDDLKKTFSAECSELKGQPIRFKDLNEKLDDASFKNASEAAVQGNAEELDVALQKFSTITAEPRRFALPTTGKKPEDPELPIETKAALHSEEVVTTIEAREHKEAEQTMEEKESEVDDKSKELKPKLLISPELKKRPRGRDEVIPAAPPTAPKFVFTPPPVEEDEG